MITNSVCIVYVFVEELTKITTHMVEMNYSYQLSTCLNFGAGGIVSSPLNTSISSSAFTNLPPPPQIQPLPPPPLTIKTSVPTFRGEIQGTVANTSKAAVKTEKGYFRIPITEEILKSVVLKPPSQRTASKKFSTKKLQQTSFLF